MYGLFTIAFLLTGFAQATNERFDYAFEQFLQNNGYRGGAVAAMKDGRLLVAKGYGLDRAGRQVTSHSKFPVSSVAKSLTATAVIRLVQDKLLSLGEKVFGQGGILYDIEPWQNGDVDPRIFDITVDYLLRHSTGWDINQGPLYDPIFNEIYLDRGHDVPNIAKKMNTTTPLDIRELISYVMTQPLTFTPGTHVAYSNFAFVVLGRVIEAVTAQDYVDYVKRTILVPCGMWKTRLQPAHYKEENDPHPSTDHDPSMLDALDLEAVGSSLGWYSNVYDMIRFTRCLFDTNTLLEDRYLDILLARPITPPIQHSHTWYCAGFRTNNKNIVWQDADTHADDLILYHNLNKPRRSFDMSLQEEDGIRHNDTDLPDSWVVLLYDKKVGHIRHQTRELMATLEPSQYVHRTDNLFLFDLSELHNHHALWELPKPLLMPEYSVVYKVDEHHISAYVNALRAEGLTMQFVSSHVHKHHTFFLVVAKKDIQMSKTDADYVFEHGMDYRQLLKRKLKMEDSGYNMTLLHSYKSESHEEPFSFAAIFRFEAFTPDVQMKYGTGHLPEPYEKLLQMYQEKKFCPLSQTVVYHGKDEHFSFIFIKRQGDSPTDFMQVYNLSPKRLTKLTMENALKNRRLAYLNSYAVAGKFRFSAVFTNTTNHQGVLEVNQPEKRATEITISNIRNGLVPKHMVPYTDNDGELKLAIYYEKL